MNFSFYILGTIQGRYSQYPDDYTANVFCELQNGFSGSRLVIFREMDLIHYVYAERLDGNNVIGFCLIFNKARLLKPTKLVNLFRLLIEKRLVESGSIFGYTEDGELKFKVKSLNTSVRLYDKLYSFLNYELESNIEKYGVEPLRRIYDGTRTTAEAPANATDGQIVIMTNQHNKVIVNSEEGIEHGYITRVINGLRERSIRQEKEISSLKYQNIRLRNKQRNTLWVGILSIIVAIMGVVLYFKVLNPSEVTHYETGEFIYYGPLKDKQPNGIGIAIYPDDDEYQRKYYIGNFVNGERQDSAAMLYYDNGDYFYGSMSGDEWEKGVFYNNSDGSNFEGTFKNNEPYTGSWYDHKLLYNLEEGKQVNSK